MAQRDDPEGDLAAEVLSERVYARLRDGIVSGVYAPGSGLTEREIAARLGVSRAPIRAAINRLEFTGFVRLAPRRKAIVTDVTRADVEQLYDLRAALEPVAARAAAANVAAGADPEPLERALARAAQAISQGESAALDHANADLHHAITTLADHALFERTFAPLQDRSDRLSAMTIAAEPALRHAEHQALVGAIVAGQPRLAEACAFTHVEQGRLRTLDLLVDQRAGARMPRASST
ncbi:GntR family transcriptional regulator [Microbacterium sp.]|uniref:GntR family transcriptional regulator n=1 Tax=Microbacterium sp. TaxID=51671 RepID=UPI0028A1EFD1|nr:GntR family transcriptional regulator [Microbacterium sp.]